MNILFVVDDYFEDAPGGSARVPWEMAKVLKVRGHAVQFFTRGVPGKPEVEEKDGWRVVRYPWNPWRPFKSMSLARRAAGRIQGPVDAVHMHHPLSGWAVREAEALKNARRIYFFHSPWAQEYLIRRRFRRIPNPAHFLAAAVMNRMERRLLMSSNRVVALSDYMAALLTARHGPPAAPILRISGAADTRRFFPRHTLQEARDELGWSRDQTILLTVRNLEARMGLENLIDALPPLVKALRGLHLYIVGEGSLARFLQERVFRWRLSRNVTFWGPALEKDLPLCYQAADAFVLPTRALEGFGLVTVEALACGCPVVATPVGATSEILRSLDPALLAESASVEHIRLALEEFLKRRPLWPALRRKCSHYARENFSWERAVDAVMSAVK